MKKSLKYQLHDFKTSLLVYLSIYLTVAIVIGAFFIWTGSKPESANLNGSNSMDFSSTIFTFIMGLAIFKEHFWMVAQNGISRKTFFKSCMYCMLIINFILAITTVVFTLFFTQMSGLDWSTMFGVLYSKFDQNIIITFIVHTFFIFSAYNLSFLSGYFVTILFYKASKIGKVIIAAGLPVLFFFILPLSYGFIPKFWNAVFNFLFHITGMESGNPLYGIITISIIAVVLGIGSYPLAKRVEI